MYIKFNRLTKNENIDNALNENVRFKFSDGDII
jgi:hypothetical protein